MSRIGNKAITIPSGVTVTVNSDVVEVKGSKGTLTTDIKAGVSVKVENDQVIVSRNNDEKQTKAFHGLVRSLISNDIVGVSEGYKKTLKLIGTGYRVQAKGQGLSITVGLSHTIEVPANPDVKFAVEGNDTIHLEGIDKQKVGQAAADIRSYRPPEPYKGKGIRYHDEEVIRKEGKTAVK